MKYVYWISLPERTLRAVAASLGGLLFEATQVLLPAWLRRSHLYQATVYRMLRLTVEGVGGVKGVMPPDDVDVGKLAVRKAAGNVVELASFVAVGWSPLWLLAAAADLTGGARVYLRALVAEIKREGLLPEDVDITSVEQLLNTFEGTSGVMADMVDVPPLNAREMRESWRALRENIDHMPDKHQMNAIFAQLQQISTQEGRSLQEVSAILGMGALRTGVQMGNTYLFDYYQQALGAIRQEGWSRYARRTTHPYLTTALSYFQLRRETYTESLARRVKQRLLAGKNPPAVE